LRVASGRGSAVVVAIVAATLLVALIGPATALAKDPPGLQRFMNAMGKVESGGRYTARNRSSGAYGKYQIMPSNWPSWAKRYLGNSTAKQTPANQEKVARGKFKDLYRGLGSWRRVAYWWLTGSSRKTGWSTNATRYVNKVMRYYNAGTGKKAATGKHFGEKSQAIEYTGTWRSARHGGYAGDKVAYATSAGATATFAFTGKKVTWYGPVGPTRGKAQVWIDGTLVRTVNLNRGSFKARVATFKTAWKTAGAHTLTIKVVGTKGHPMVAIDEFVVTP
jgi:hypothetical protein